MKLTLEIIAAILIATFLAIGVSKAEPMTLTENELDRVTAGYPGMSIVQSLVELNHYGFYLNPINIVYKINKGILRDHFYGVHIPPGVRYQDVGGMPAGGPLTSDFAINRFGY